MDIQIFVIMLINSYEKLESIAFWKVFLSVEININPYKKISNRYISMWMINEWANW